jgi:hypothetical protein
VDGTVRIAANKGDLTITDQSGTTTLPQGQQTTRDEQSDQSTQSTDTDKDKKKKKKQAAGAAPGATGGALSSPVAIGVGLAIVGGVGIWVLTRNDDPVSPSTP